MDIQLLKDFMVGLVRYLLFGLFSGLIARGYIKNEQIIALSPWIAGLLIVLGSMAVRKLKSKYRVVAAIELPPGSTIPEVKQLAAEKNPLPKILS